MIRSKYSLCQIITLFSRQLQNLLYQLARPPAATVYLSYACRGKGLRGPAGPPRGGRRAGSCPDAFSRATQVEGMGAPIRGLENRPVLLARPATAAGALFSAGAAPARLVAQEREPSEPGRVSNLSSHQARAGPRRGKRRAWSPGYGPVLTRWE